MTDRDDTQARAAAGRSSAGGAPRSAARGPRPTRRRLVRAGAAVVGGLVLSTTYVKPAVRSVALHDTVYASGLTGSRPPPPPPLLPNIDFVCGSLSYRRVNGGYEVSFQITNQSAVPITFESGSAKLDARPSGSTLATGSAPGGALPIASGATRTITFQITVLRQPPRGTTGFLLTIIVTCNGVTKTFTRQW